MVPLASVEMTLVFTLTCYFFPPHRNADLSGIYNIQDSTSLSYFKIWDYILPVNLQSSDYKDSSKVRVNDSEFWTSSFSTRGWHSFALEVYISLNR